MESRMAMELTILERARALGEAGRAGEGLQFLRNAQARGEADAFFTEGLWHLEGRFVPRDVAQARTLIAMAAEAGHLEAARTLAALVARGAGAPADWSGAVSILDAWSARDPWAQRQADLIAKMDLDQNGDSTRTFERRLLCEAPTIARVDNLLAPDECKFLIEIAEPRMERSMIFSDELRRFVEDPVRTSDTAGFPAVFEWPFVRAINRRIARATGTAIECAEPLQVLKYRPGQQYRPHYDSRVGIDNPRIITAVIWLNDDYAGGETCFDEVGVAERGGPGDMLFFANTLADGSPDPRSRHAGAPVASGVKYLASRWVRARAWQGGGQGLGPPAR
jgi:prolyl 4-hydroxylase